MQRYMIEQVKAFRRRTVRIKETQDPRHRRGSMGT